MSIFVWVLSGVGAFLVIDSLLALVLGKRYMLWGLEHTPSFYRDFITRLSGLPARKLLVIKLVEGVIGLVLVVLAWA